jgi:hypothetical protein
MSASCRITSASPPYADIFNSAAEGPLLNIPPEIGRANLNILRIFAQGSIL